MAGGKSTPRSLRQLRGHVRRHALPASGRRPTGTRQRLIGRRGLSPVAPPCWVVRRSCESAGASPGLGAQADGDAGTTPASLRQDRRVLGPHSAWERHPRRPRRDVDFHPKGQRAQGAATLSLRAVAVAQSHVGKAAARSRQWAPERLGATTSRRSTCARRTRWPFSEPTLRSDPAGSPGVYATATAG